MTLDPRHSAYLEAVGRDLETAARRYAGMRRRRRTQLRVTALSITAVILLAGSALAGSSLLGMKAPGFVQATLDSLWPPDDTTDLTPVAGTARLVAQSDNATLYRSRANGTGAVCLSIVYGKHRHISCMTRVANERWALPLSSTVVGDRQFVLGQIRIQSGATLVAQWQGGEPIRIAIGFDGFFLGEVPLANPGAKAKKVSLRIVDGDGFVIGQRDLERFSANSAAP
jgi:hypothetical protein